VVETVFGVFEAGLLPSLEKSSFASFRERYEQRTIRNTLEYVGSLDAIINDIIVGFEGGEIEFLVERC
jgi:hypothetical protein